MFNLCKVAFVRIKRNALHSRLFIIINTPKARPDVLSGALDGRVTCHMSILRNNNVALSNLRNDHVTLSILRNCHVPCHYLLKSHVACH